MSSVTSDVSVATFATASLRDACEKAQGIAMARCGVAYLVGICSDLLGVEFIRHIAWRLAGVVTDFVDTCRRVKAKGGDRRTDLRSLV